MPAPVKCKPEAPNGLRPAIAAAGLALIAGHNLFDGIKAEQLGAAAMVVELSLTLQSSFPHNRDDSLAVG